MSPTSRQAIIDLLADRPIAYHPMLAKALGGVVEAVFVSQLLYWTGKGKLAGGWIFKTQAEMEDETGLTRSNQETARKNLVKMGVLEEARRGVPGKMHFRLNLDRIADLVTMLKPHNVETPQCEMGESDNAQCEDSAKYNAETPQCIPENTIDHTETTGDLPFSENPLEGLPVGIDGQQRAVDKANGGTALDPVEETARHLWWLCAGRAARVPKRRGLAEYLKAAGALLDLTDKSDWRSVCETIDRWAENPPDADKWWREHTKSPNYAIEHLKSYYWAGKGGNGKLPARNLEPYTPAFLEE